MKGSSTPTIRVSQYHRCATSGSSPLQDSPPYPSHSPASPMSIPNAARDPQVPPPLPPPRHVDYEDLNSPGQQKQWQQFFNKDYVNQHYTDFGREASVKPGSSLLGGEGRSKIQESDNNEHAHSGIIDPAQRESSLSRTTPTPQRGLEGMSIITSLGEKEDASSRPSNHSLQSERQLGYRALHDSSHKYDQHLLSKIGGPNTPSRLSVSYSPGGDTTPISPSTEPRSDQPRHLSIFSDRRHPSIDGTNFRWAVSTSGATSPGSVRSPIFDPENTRPTAHRHSNFLADENASHRSSYDQAMFMHGNDLSMEGGQFKDLNINDRSPSVSEEFHFGAKPGIKRRASSPHRESAREDRTSISSAPGDNDLYTRRSLQQVPNRQSPNSRTTLKHGSVSSASSYAPRHGSLASSYNLSVASSATSYASERVSPGNGSPAIDPELGSMSCPTSKPVLPSPIKDSLQHQVFSEVRQQPRPQTPADSVLHSRQNSVPNVQGLYICDCCPKKPNKFGTEDELRAHHSEKQYTCAYCPNRFKNKNEAERHQNSLHLRRHSWSCATLPTVNDIFHTSHGNDGTTDACGFCGEEFPNPPDWDQRRVHVSHVHKFGECNQTKKFFRADHFRQHLKHSHAGTSGKWTNMLENACMRDEGPPPQPVADRALQAINVGSFQGVSSVPTAPMLGVPSPSGLSPSGSVLGTPYGKPEVIDEEPHES